MESTDVYAIACLAGGQVRAVDTAVVGLLCDGRLRAGETGELSTAELRYGHPVEAAVLDAIGRRAHSVHTVRYRCAGDERLTGLVEELALAGLLHRGRRLTSWGRVVLREARARGADGAAWRLALHGLDALPDQALRHRVFDLPRRPHRIGHGYLALDLALSRADGGQGMFGIGDHGP